MLADEQSNKNHEYPQLSALPHCQMSNPPALSSQQRHLLLLRGKKRFFGITVALVMGLIKDAELHIPTAQPWGHCPL